MLFLLALLPFAQGALPTDGANVYFCPKGYCLGPSANVGGFVGPAASFVECQDSSGSVPVEVYNPFMDSSNPLGAMQPWSFVFDPKASYIPATVNGAYMADTCCRGHSEVQCTSFSGRGTSGGGGNSGGGGGGKPGGNSKCPKVTGGMVGICISSCAADSDCSSGQACCSNGCGQVCTAVSTVKARTNPNCPVLAPGMVGTCQYACKADGGCSGADEICCSNGCGTECIKDPTVPRQLGDECGSCYCPSLNYDAGFCDVGLTCQHDPMIPDKAGECVSSGASAVDCTTLTAKTDCAANGKSWCSYKKRLGGCTWDKKVCKNAMSEQDCDDIVAAGGACKKKMKKGRFKKCKKSRSG